MRTRQNAQIPTSIGCSRNRRLITSVAPALLFARFRSSDWRRWKCPTGRSGCAATSGSYRHRTRWASASRHPFHAGTRGEYLSCAREWPQLRIFWGRSIPHIFDRGWVYQGNAVARSFRDCQALRGQQFPHRHAGIALNSPVIPAGLPKLDKALRSARCVQKEYNCGIR